MNTLTLNCVAVIYKGKMTNKIMKNKKGEFEVEATKIFLAFFLFLFIMVLVWGVESEKYTTDKIVPCNDVDGDLIKDLVCYEVIKCSDNLKFLNPEGCKEFVK